MGIHLDGQWRRHNQITRGQQLLLPPAIDYEITAGYAFIATYRYGGLPVAFPFAEHRIYLYSTSSDEARNVPLSMGHGDHFDEPIYGPVKDQVISNGPEKKRAFFGQIRSPMSHAGSRRQSENPIIQLSGKAVSGIEAILGDVLPDVVEILSGVRREDESLHARFRRRNSDFSRI